MPGRKRDDRFAISDRPCAYRHDQAAIHAARKYSDGALDYTGIAHVDRAQLHPPTTAPRPGKHFLKDLPLPLVRSLVEAFLVMSYVLFDDKFPERLGRLLQR